MVADPSAERPTTQRWKELLELVAGQTARLDLKLHPGGYTISFTTPTAPI